MHGAPVVVEPPRRRRPRAKRGEQSGSAARPGRGVCVNATGRHIALIGFMGSGKTTSGAALARLLERPFIDVDDELERRQGATISQLFDQRGEHWFRTAEAELTRELLERLEPAVLALGGGAVGRAEPREATARRAITGLPASGRDEAWARASATHRRLAQEEERFRTLYAERQPVYGETADAVASDLEGIVLALAGIVVEEGSVGRLDELVPGDGPVA